MQAQVRARNVANAASQSQAAKPWVLNHIDTVVRPGLTGLPCASEPAETLLEMLTWEFKRLPSIHNAPLEQKAAINDDTDMQTTLTNGYLQNVAQRYVLGVEETNNMIGEGRIMETYMNFPPFKNKYRPTLREANDRVFYLASNLGKKQCGNFQYGDLTYVINPLYQDKWFIAPGDTGEYHTNKLYGPPMPMGTLDDFYHLIQPHFASQPAPTLAQLFQRWYGGASAASVTPPGTAGEFVYFEIEMAANCWLPEGLLYTIAKFSEMWGKDLGLWLQEWSLSNRRPLIWSDGDDSGMILDPVVNQLTGTYINATMQEQFKAMWKTPSLPFSSLLSATSPALHFELQSYYKRSICAKQEQSNLMVMGYNAVGDCVYWTPPSLPPMYECLNDGTCAQSMGGRGTFFTQDQCTKNCGQGNWSCVQNANLSKCAGDDAIMCVPAVQGKCNSLAACEVNCGQ